MAILKPTALKGWRQPPNRPRHWLLSAAATPIVALSAATVLAYDQSTRVGDLIPPRSMLYLTCALSGLTILYVVRVAYSNSLFSKPMIGARYFALQDFLDTLPDAKGIFDQMVEEVSSQRISVGSELFRSHMDELKFELKTFVRIYLWTQFNRLLRMLVHGSLAAILLFSCLYAGLAAEDAANQDEPILANALGGLMLDSLYYSAGTFATVGFSAPGNAELVSTKVVTVLQVLTSLFFLSIAVSLASDFVQITSLVNPTDLAESIESELLAASRSQVIIEIPSGAAT